MDSARSPALWAGGPFLSPDFYRSRPPPPRSRGPPSMRAANTFPRKPGHVPFLCRPPTVSPLSFFFPIPLPSLFFWGDSSFIFLLVSLGSPPSAQGTGRFFPLTPQQTVPRFSPLALKKPSILWFFLRGVVAVVRLSGICCEPPLFWAPFPPHR